MDPEVDDIRETISAAMEPKEEVAEPEKPEVAEPEKVEEEPVKVEETKAEKEEPVKEEEPPAEPEVKTKPPASWKAGAKERWAKLDPEIQREVARREHETTVAIQQGAEGRKFAEEFHRVIDPFRAVMAAEGAPNPLVAVQNLMQSATTLRLGTPLQKAGMVANLIKNYGVDVRMLDNLLGDAESPELKQQSDMERMFQERLSPLQQRLEQYERQIGNQQQQVQAQAAKTVETFVSTHDFADDPDIANTMADLLDVAAKRGKVLSIDNAYTQAIALNPEISKIVEQRKLAKKVSSLDAARLASSSVKGTPMGGTAPLDATDMRATIMAAMDGKI